MSLKIAVQMDPIQRINIKGDSTFALLLEAQSRGHKLSYYTPDRLALLNGRLFATVESLAVRDQVGDHFTLDEPRRVELTEFDVILLRQDPPFDLAYVTTTHLLERIHPEDAGGQRPGACPQRAGEDVRHRISRPDAADAAHPRSRRDQGVPRRARRHRDEAALRQGRRARCSASRAEDLNFGSLYDMFAATFREQWVVQKFLPAIKHGDKRIILVDGEFAGAVNRIPAADDLRSNMVRGGAPAATELTKREAEICKKIGPSLRERGLLFVGIDVIDGFLTEINVTSPTGIRAIKNLGGARHRGADLGQDRGEAEAIVP